MAFKLIPPKPFVPVEYSEQVTVFEWCDWHKVELVYATLNGVKLPIGLAVKMSKAGLKRGPLDIVLDQARGGYHGLRIELKRVKGGVISDEQKIWLSLYEQHGYHAKVCRGAKEAIAVIEEYLRWPLTQVLMF